MAFIEVVALLVVASVLITVIMSIGRPVAEMLAERSRYKFKGMDSEAEAKLLKRVEALEEELRQVNKKLSDLKDSSEFALKLIENKPEVLKLSAEEKQKEQA